LSTICYPIEQIHWNEEDAETVTISNELPGDDIASFTEQAYQPISSAIARLELKLSKYGRRIV
jgi:hypothetical protein